MMKKIKLGSIIVLILIMSIAAAGCGDTASSGSDSEGGSDSAKASYDVGEATASSWTDSIGSFWIKVSVPVTNNSEDNLCLSSATMDIEDSEGNLVANMSLVSATPDVIGPGETAWYYETITVDSEPASALTAVPHFEVKKVKNARIDLEVSDTSLSDFYGDIRVLGKIKNTNEAETDLVKISAFFYDAEGKLIGQAFTYTDGSLAPGEAISFEAMTMGLPPSVNVSAVADYKVIAYQENIIDF